MLLIRKETKPRFIPQFVFNFFLKTYYNQGGIYVDAYGFPTAGISTKVKWLEELKVLALSEKRADKITWAYFNTKYPQYKGLIKLF